ncbi:hypothetical protein K3N28_08570 [Glycomyces sp. TRM65418]|uniref:hypothetical protein n=1 Tax=Glycomyces sp. TRM65418 TaxID=2867006 RepID=UPI001CE4EB0B|nr:hypothetical protein [Glycomyces sp. TRM65418]MCC3763123.1 hypothetical protein [Glycomyces sp. TRM65418]QZD57131.1 hypothetical protein K3N28_08510 [Glycomyces sp. TRM65418]
MDFMRRNARWIALLALVAMATPFLAQGLNTLFAVDTFLVVMILFAATIIAVVVLARSPSDED